MWECGNGNVGQQVPRYPRTLLALRYRSMNISPLPTPTPTPTLTPMPPPKAFTFIQAQGVERLPDGTKKKLACILSFAVITVIYPRPHFPSPSHTHSNWNSGSDPSHSITSCLPVQILSSVCHSFHDLR